MRGNIVAAAAVFGGAVVLASVILVVGIFIALNRATGRVTDAVQVHGQMVRDAGTRAGEPISAALTRLDQTVARHADAVAAAGQNISRPIVRMQDPVPIIDQQPLRIQGTVGVEMGENKESKKGSK